MELFLSSPSLTHTHLHNPLQWPSPLKMYGTAATVLKNLHQSPAIDRSTENYLLTDRETERHNQREREKIEQRDNIRGNFCQSEASTYLTAQTLSSSSSAAAGASSKYICSGSPSLEISRYQDEFSLSMYKTMGIYYTLNIIVILCRSCISSTV